MTWIGWLILLAGLYLLVVLLRGAVQFVSWFVQEHIIEPRELRHSSKAATDRRLKPKPAKVGAKRETKPQRKSSGSQSLPLPVASQVQARKPSGLSRSLKTLKVRFLHKSYDSWIAAALAKEDPVMKVEYLSRALRLNPTYIPAWGLKANALFGLQRYGEAIACFEKTLEVHPSALAWHKKGICCHHVGKREEALRCFTEALATCPREDRQLFEDAVRMKKVVEDELQRA